MNDEKKLYLEELPFDTYGRHALIRDIINLDRSGDKIKILDVGGRYNLMTKFFPNDEVFYLDLEINPGDKNAVQGDGCDIPLKDNSFDYVVSSDVFEHIKQKDRQRFLRECMRVAKNGLVLAAPFYSKEVEEAEKIANESYKIIFGGQDHRWLIEHIKNGLPREDEVKNFVKSNNLYSQVSNVNNLGLWAQLITIGFIAIDKGLISEEYSRFNKFYNQEIYPIDRTRNSYRKIFLIKRENNFNMPKITEEIPLDLYLRAVSMGNNLTFGVISKLESNERELILKNQEIRKEMKQQLDQKHKELEEKVKETEEIRTSTSWKVTKPMRKIKDISNKVLLLGKKSITVIKEEGVFEFFKRVGKYVTHRTIARLHQQKTFSHSYLDISQWYQGNKKKVTVVIPSYNDYKLLKKCIDSINRTADERYVDVIIVDDASTKNEHQSFLKSLNQKNIKVIYNKKNSGFAKTVNVGMKAAKTGDIVVLNSDIEAKKYWLESLQYAAYSSKDIGIVGGKLLYPNKTIQYAGSYRNLDAPEWFDHYYRFKPSSFPPANIPNFVLGITGACMYIKSEVIKNIGYMDEKFPMAFEDMDYSIRAWNVGYKSLYFPMATLIHHESITRGTKQGAREKESLRYFWQKWGDWFDKRNVRNSEGVTKIIYVIQSTGVGGGARIIFEHVNKLKELGYDVELYNLEGNPKWFKLDVPVKTFKNYSQLIKALENEEAIKVATWWETAEPVWLSSVRKGVPVYFVQDIESSYYKDDEYMQNFVLSKYRKEFRYFTTSGVNEKALKDMGLIPAVIPCGMDTTIYKPLEVKREKDVMLSVGRSHYLKNLTMTMDAWKEIKDKQPTFWMFGIEPQVADGIQNTKYYYKPTDEGVNELYNKATIFVQTSRHEGFCLPVLEAMAAGAPVICTDAHGNADFCVDGENCLMIEHDDVNNLKRQIKKLFSDKKLQEKLRKSGYKTAQQYSWPVIMKKLTNFFDNIANN